MKTRLHPTLWAPHSGFSLLEVMIAMGIFFMAIFAILSLVTTTLRNARRLQEAQVDAGPLISELSATNRLVEGTESGDFGDIYPNYRWTREIHEVSTNGFYQVEFLVQRVGGDAAFQSHLTALLYRPDSKDLPGQRRP